MPLQPQLSPNALTTLETVKLFLPASVEESADALFTMMINQASDWIEQQLQRKLGKASYDEWLYSTGRQWLMLREWPILSVEEVTQQGQIIAPEMFLVEPDGYAGCLYKDDGWTWFGYRQGLAADPVAASRNIRVKYTAGYVLPKDATEDNPRTLPYDIEQLCIDMLLRAFGTLENGGTAGLKSFAISDVRWEWDNTTPESWKTTIASYRRGWL